jgi:fatty-acyl-CoA synthase/long-chain acyl-CoA synthetase
MVAAARPSTPSDFLTERARAHPEKLAVVEERPGGPTTRWSFAELNEQVNRLANALGGLGVRAGDRVLWCGRNSPGVIRAIHAARKLGATAVPLSYRFAAREALHVVRHSDAVACVIDAEHTDLFAELRPQIPGVRDILVFDGAPGPGMRSAEELIAAASPAEPLPPPAGHFAALMTYTSGTTGLPKGALREAPGNPAQSYALVQALDASPDDVYITTGPLYHSGPGGWLSLTHSLGNTVVVLRHFDPEEWLRLVERYRVTCTTCAPTPMRRICSLPGSVKEKYDCSSLRYVLGSAAAWPYELKQAYVRDFGNDSLFETYGSSELGGVTLMRPEDQLARPGSCGRAAPGVEIELVDAEGGVIEEPFKPGELYARSGANFTSYHKDASAYAAVSRGEFRTSGDVAYRDADGFYYICDRKVDMVVSGGVNIYPREIEEILERHPDVAEAAVFGIPSEEWGETVHAALVARGAARPSLEEISAFARPLLAGYKLPRSIEWADALPRNELGKILKRELREPHWKGRSNRVV